MQPDVVFDGGLSQYSSRAVAARQTLVDEGWTITDGGQVPRWFAAQPDPVAFGDVSVGDGQPLVVTITSTGAQPLEFPAEAVSLTGAGAGQYSVIQDTCSNATVGPGATCGVELVFSPTSPGAKSATLTPAESSGEPLPEVSVTGTGRGPAMSVSPAAVDFGDHRTGTVSDASTVTVTNTGNEPLQVTSVGLVGADAHAFTIDSDGCGGTSVAAGQHCQVEVRFRPSFSGDLAARVRISDDAWGAPHDVPLTGVGVSPWFVVAPAPHDFGDQQVGTVSDVLTMTVTNTGSALLHGAPRRSPAPMPISS